ncbi:LuxR C-terminal-related transcriptional regulator [Enemella sp. A6]|uniref:helix-turn-helix transcriptional regulator n=1 Tax=Enemella sp. A6 TaxID=3440152 RepID=UPI003EBF12E8
MFLAQELCRGALTTMHGPDAVAELVLDSPEPALDAHAGKVLLVKVPADRIGTLVEGAEHLLKAVAGGQIGGLLVIVDANEIPAEISDLGFERVLGHHVLVMTAQEMASLLPPKVQQIPGATSSLEAFTGAVPGLVAAVDLDDPEVPAPIMEAAMPWAEQFVAAARNNPLLMLHVWGGMLSCQTMASLASHMMGEGINADDVRDVRSGAFFLGASSTDEVAPYALLEAAREVVARFDPQLSQRIRRSLRAAAVATPTIGAFDKLEVLTSLQDWAGLDAVLADSMHLLAAAGYALRARIKVLWPCTVAANLRYLTHARRFLDGELRASSPANGTHRSYADLEMLFEQERQPEPESGIACVRDLLTPPIPIWTVPPDVGSDRLEHVMTWIESTEEEAAQYTGGARTDLAIVLILVVLGTADNATQLGRLQEAYELANRALRLTQWLDHREMVHALRIATMSRLAFLAAVIGMPSTAQYWLRRYDEKVRLYGGFNEDSDRLVEITRRFTSLPSADGEEGLQLSDPNASFIAFEAEVEALRAVLMRDANGALTHLRSIANLSTWSQYPAWTWWPFFMILALVEAREGHLDSAQKWVDRAALPSEKGGIVKAYSELAAGRHTTAGLLARQELGIVDLTPRCRALAVGVMLSLPDISDVEREVLFSSVLWEESLDAVCLLPRVAQELVVDRLGLSTDRYPGLAPTPSPPEPTTQLTRRQLEVLEALDSSRTLAQIARAQHVGVETIRSTTKEIYRRLGVRDRHSAVRMGRALNLL